MMREQTANALAERAWSADTIDVELEFPLNMHNVKRALRESFGDIPDWASEITATTPQLAEDYASFVAYPVWLHQASLVIDARKVYGPVFSYYEEGRVSRERASSMPSCARAPARRACARLPRVHAALPTFRVTVGGKLSMLRSKTRARLSFKAEARHRLALAAQACEAAKPLLVNNKALSLETRVALFDITVATSFFMLAIVKTHGEAWESLRAGHARLARRLLAQPVSDERLFRIPLPASFGSPDAFR